MTQNSDIDQLDFLDNCRGTATSCISYYMTGKHRVEDANKRISSEITTAENIKDKRNRERVKSSLSCIREKLKNVRNGEYDTGLAIFAGSCI